MDTLTDKDIMRVWEAGAGRPLWFRAMLILAYALPGMSKGELADLTIGQRNYYLLKLRQRMVGQYIDSLVNCPECGEPLEFRMDARDILAMEPNDSGQAEYCREFSGYRITFRSLTSRDLSVLGNCGTPVAGRDLLLERCILGAEKDGVDVGIPEIPGEVIEELGEYIAVTADPQVEIRFKLECAACRHSWSALFDIVSYFWIEIDAQAQRLLHEVHVLARAYGWSEIEILKMHSSRKQYYLELVS